MDDQDPISRRDLLRKKFGAGLFQSIGYAMGQAHGVRKHIEQTLREPVPDDQESPAPPELAVFHRPPGSVDEISFAAQCTKCNACIEACPAKTLVPLTNIFGKAYGTPVVDPSLGGCEMCEDRPCASVCASEGSNIINSILPMKMGHAVVHRSSCLSHIGSECTICIERCPIEGTITHDWRKIPVIDQDLCTGCGMCISTCPAEPAALSIIPSKERPPKPTQQSHE